MIMKRQMFTYLLYCIEILDEGEGVQRYNRQTKDIEKKTLLWHLI